MNNPTPLIKINARSFHQYPTINQPNRPNQKKIRLIGSNPHTEVNACEIINNIFSPTKEQLEEATSHVKVFEKARKLGQGQVDFDGIRIEMPTYLNALEVIKRFNELKQFN